MARYIISEQQFSECFEKLARHNIKIDNMTIVKHVDGSSIINKIDGTSSPSDYWKKHFNDPIEPSDMLCTSCMKKADKFVVGHVEDLEQTKMWLYPVCSSCNNTYKGNKSNHIFYADNKKLKEIDITQIF